MVKAKRKRKAAYKHLLPAAACAGAFALIAALSVFAPSLSGIREAVMAAAVSSSTVTLSFATYTQTIYAQGTYDGVENLARAQWDTAAAAHAVGTPFYYYSAIHLNPSGYAQAALGVGNFIKAHLSLFDSSQMTVWGDSLTYSFFPGDLGKYLGTTAHVEGVPGQSSTQIAMRQGGDPITMTVTNNTIQAGANTVTQINGQGFPGPYSFLYSPADTKSRSVRGSLNGIPGMLVSVVTGTTLPTTHETYTFTPDDTTLPATSIPPNSPFVIDNGTLNDGTVVIWAGRNNFSHAAVVEQDIANMVAHLGANQHYLILSILNEDAPTEYKGQTNYNEITALNSYLAQTYPGHYYDLREYLVNDALAATKLTPTPIDQMDIANDAPPASLHFIMARGTLVSGMTASSTEAALTYAVGSPAAGQILTIGGTERIVTGAGTASGLYAVYSSTDTYGLYPLTDTFNITGGSGTNVFIGGPGDDTLTGGPGNDRVQGGDGNDTITTGDGNDAVQGGAGADTIIGGAGYKIFVYAAASDSTGENYDTIKFLNIYADRFKLPVAISQLEKAITAGSLSKGSIDADLAAVLTPAAFPPYSAVIFTPNTGTLSGIPFLVINLTSAAGYKSGADVVIRLASPGDLSYFTSQLRAFIH